MFDRLSMAPVWLQVLAALFMFTLSIAMLAGILYVLLRIGKRWWVNANTVGTEAYETLHWLSGLAGYFGRKVMFLLFALWIGWPVALAASWIGAVLAWEARDYAGLTLRWTLAVYSIFCGAVIYLVIEVVARKVEEVRLLVPSAFLQAGRMKWAGIRMLGVGVAAVLFALVGIPS